ncbi:MAG: hypothetical protein R2706_20465 [Acidimicrobiales bacterium]
MGVADVFRTEWPLLVATLLRDVGDLNIAEDAAQGAFLEASTRWPTGESPSGQVRGWSRPADAKPSIRSAG